MCETEDYKIRLKKYPVECRWVSLNIYLYCVYRAFFRPLLGATISLNLVPWVLKKELSSEMDKNNIYLECANKQSALFFRKFALKNTLMPLISRIDPGLIFLVFNTHSLHNLHRAIASSIYNVGTTRKLLLFNFNF